MKKLLLHLPMLLLAAGFAAPAMAAEDNASSGGAYADGKVTSGENGGAGWGAWQVAGSPVLVGDAAAHGGESTMNSGGKAFVVASEGTGRTVTRELAARSAGKAITVSAKLEAVTPYPGDAIGGFYLRTKGGANLVAVTVDSRSGGGSANWQVNHGSGREDSGIPFTKPVRVEITDAGNGSFRSTITPLSGGGAHQFSGKTIRSGTTEAIMIHPLAAGSGSATLIVNDLKAEEK